jgi:hypothetical protein
MKRETCRRDARSRAAHQSGKACPNYSRCRRSANTETTAGRTYTRPPSVRFSSSPRHAASASCASEQPCTSAAYRGRLLEGGATLFAGRSAHVFHGLDRRVLYDLGDFLDDRRRFREACAAFGSEVAEEEGRLVASWR